MPEHTGARTWGGKGLTIGGRHHGPDELNILCLGKAEDRSLPPWERALYAFIRDWLGGTDHILQRSSGTTGKPKDLQLPKSAMEASARATCDFFDLRPGASAHLCLPVDYIAGKMMVVRAFVGELDLLAVEPSSRPGIPAEGVDFSAMVPLQVSNTLEAGEGLSRVRTLIVGGAEISPELEASLSEQRTAVWATYGMAETCSQIALRRVNGKSPEGHFTAMRDVRLLLDGRGCLAIETSWLPARVQTNDVVEMLDEVRFRWLGRYDNLINSGGLKIVPEEIEAVISRVTGRPCAVVGLPDDRLGSRAVAVFEAGEGLPGAEGLMALLETEVARPSIPREVLVVERFPRNASFKIDRRGLAELLRYRDSR